MNSKDCTNNIELTGCLTKLKKKFEESISELKGE